MNKMLLTLSLVGCILHVLAQTPQGFSYQAVVRDAEGQPIANQQVHLRISLQNRTGNTAYYTEEHAEITDSRGVVSLVVGNGENSVGSFTDIPWSFGEIHLKLEIDLESDNVFTELGAIKLQSVPYALYAADGFSVPGSKGQSLTHSGTDWVATSNIYTNEGDSIGIGTTVPEEKLHVTGNIKASGALIGQTIQVGDPVEDPDAPLFVVRNSSNQVVFAVYESGVRMYVDSDAAKSGSKGGFAVGGLTQSKAGEEYLRVTPDSVRIYIDTTSTEGKSGSKGGFAVGGLTQSKGTPIDLLKVTADSTRIYVSEGQAKSGSKGGFAVGGLTQSKAIPADLLYISPDSARIYIDTSPEKSGSKGGFAVGGLTQSKDSREDYLRVTRDSTRVYINDEAKSGSKGGFAVGGLTQSKGTGTEFFNVSTDEVTIVEDEARILWYPVKNAFFAGLVSILDPLDVGLNSMSIGYKTKSKGNYSQALGFQSQALGDYSTAIGNNAIVNGVNSYGFGNNTFVSNSNSYAIGNGANVLGEGAYAIGSGAMAQGNYSFALGSDGIDSAGVATNATKALGDYSYAFGMGSLATNRGAFAIGTQDTASGQFSVAIGYEAKATGNYGAVAIGRFATASGEHSIALGYRTQAQGDMSSTAMGFYSIASGMSATAMGGLTEASGNNSTAMGGYTVASGDHAIAMGKYTVSSGWMSAGIGFNDLASGEYSISIGSHAKAIGYCSTTIGNEIKAYSQYETVIGMRNDTTYSDPTDEWIETTPIFTVGIGKWGPRNALMVLKNGNVGIGGYPGATGSNALAIINTGLGYQQPTDPIADGILLFAQDVSESAELRVMDEAGNVTTLSPHSFTLTHKSEPMAWSFYSKNKTAGYEINVDMLKAIRIIEDLSGEKLVFIKDLKTQKIVNNELHESLTKKIEQQQAEIESLKSELEAIKQLLTK